MRTVRVLLGCDRVVTRRLVSRVGGGGNFGSNFCDVECSPWNRTFFRCGAAVSGSLCLFGVEGDDAGVGASVEHLPVLHSTRTKSGGDEGGDIFHMSAVDGGIMESSVVDVVIAVRVTFCSAVERSCPFPRTSQVKKMAAEYDVEDGPDLEGEMFERPGRQYDR